MNDDKKYDVALTVGVFDMLHEGHVELFEMMKGMARKVVVMVHDDLSTWRNKKRFPVQRFGHRKELVGHFADMVVSVREADPGERIKTFLARGMGGSPKIVYVRGDDWPEFPGRKAVEELGIEVVLKKYTEGVSSTERRKEL